MQLPTSLECTLANLVGTIYSYHDKRGAVETSQPKILSVIKLIKNTFKVFLINSIIIIKL